MSLWRCLNEVKPLVLYNVERRMALAKMYGNRPSFLVDLGYTELFHVPVVTSVSF